MTAKMFILLITTTPITFNTKAFLSPSHSPSVPLLSGGLTCPVDLLWAAPPA